VYAGPVGRPSRKPAGISVGVVGASGYTGAELLRLCAQHPHFEVRAATAESHAGTPIAELYPSLSAAYGGLTLEKYDPVALDGLDVVFLALPHGVSQAIVPDLAGTVGTIIDLGADFRLADPALYPAWYGQEHTRPELLPEFVYGLPELFREEIRGARHIAAPGCYVTTALLALAPLVEAGMVDPSNIVVDAASGASGAGRPPKDATTFCAVDEDFSAYGLLTHRHTPEIEQGLSKITGSDVRVLFTPHLAPMNRGILATCYARPATLEALPSSERLLTTLHDAWNHEPFVVVTDRSPSTKATLGSNAAHVMATADPRTGWIIAMAALDNLVKGASGQAIQCANLALGLAETTGLPIAGVYP
jgi:N-acetyl-gamma-glutamyl-phosphate reductase